MAEPDDNPTRPYPADEQPTDQFAPVPGGIVDNQHHPVVLGRRVDLRHVPQMVGEGPLRQASAPEHALGRVNASMQVLDGALSPLGALVGGVLGGLIGIQGTLFIAAAGIIASRAWLVFSPVPRLRDPSELRLDGAG